MALKKQRKEELIAIYTDLINQSKAIIFTEYRGLSNRNLTDLRVKVREAGGVIHVAKLSLFKKALEAAGSTVPESLSGAPIAIGFCTDDVPAVAKALYEYANTMELFAVRGGLMDGASMSAKQVKMLADLPPFDVVRAQLLGLLDAPASNLVGVVQASVAQVVNVLNAYVDKGKAA